MENWISKYKTAAKFFSRVPQNDLRELEVIELLPGDILIEQSALDDNSLYYVLSGVLEGKNRDIKEIRDGVYFVPIKISKDSFIGFSELIQNTPTRRAVSVFAKTDAVILKIPREMIFRWASHNQQVFFEILTHILSASWKQREILTTCNTQAAEARLAFHLLYLYQLYLYSCYEDHFKGSVRIPDTHTELSQAISASSRTVDRCIVSLHEYGYISLRKGKIYINNHQSDKLQNYFTIHSAN